MPKLPSLVTGVFVVPVLIAAITILQLNDILDTWTTAFFGYTTSQQMAVLGLIFSVIFGCLAIAAAASAPFPSSRSSVIGSSSSAVSQVTAKIRYPLDAIAAADSDKEKFKALYPSLRDEILECIKTENELLPEAVDWVREMMEYSVPGGKLNRGTTVIDVYRTLLGRPLTHLEVARAAVAGWCIEFLQAFFLVADDVMDGSPTRRGQPCWYKLPHVNKIAINDSFLLESFVFQLMRTHFGKEPYYLDMLELMLDVTQKTEIGQLLDLTSQPADGKIDLNRFTIQRYRSIVKYKTAFYSFYLPVAMGMLMSGIRDPEAYGIAKKICCIMGEYFQIQDDYLDCFGDPELIGKVGTDIQDNKCSWLVVQALDRCTPGQRDFLAKNYGQWDDTKVGRIKQLYRDLGLAQLFHEYEEDSYKEIQAELDKLTLIPREMFELFLKKIYKRSK